MARVLFIERRLRNEKLGIMCLSAVLKAAGHTVELVQTESEDLCACMQGFRPDFLAYSLMTGEHGRAIAVNRELKKQFSFISVFGGPHCTFFPEIGREEGVDYVVQGAGEEILLHIVEGKVPPGTHRGDITPNLDKTPFPDRALFYKYPNFRDNSLKNIMTIRDCPYNCSYCYNHLWKDLYADQRSRLFQRRAVASVIREIDEIRARYPLEKINFLDDNFLQQKTWIKEFCAQYGNTVRLPFLINVRVNLVDEETVAALHGVGLEMVNFALESASPDIQKNLLDRGDFSNEDVSRSIAIFKKYGIRVRMQNMIGLPVPDPLTDALDTLAFNLDNQVEDAWVSIFQPYPKTKLARYCEENGYVEGNSVDACADSFFDESRLNIRDRDRLARLQSWWYYIIRYNLPMELVRFFLELPLTPEQSDLLLQNRYLLSRKYFYGLDGLEPIGLAPGNIQKQPPSVPSWKK